jgi:protein-disulfide isomerase
MPNASKFSVLNVVLIACVLFLSGLSLYLAYDARQSKMKFGEDVRQYLISNPTVIKEAIEVLTAYEQKEERTKTSQQMTELGPQLKNDGYSFVGGNPDGDVTVVEFFDYRCGYCKRSFPTLMKTVKADGNVRIVFKEFPILGPASVTASMAAIAAIKQNKYMELHVAMMESRGSLTDAKVFEIAGTVGLDIDVLKKDMASAETKTAISKNYELAKKLGINGTPAFIIGDELAPGAIPPDQMSAMISAARQSNTN